MKSRWTLLTAVAIAGMLWSAGSVPAPAAAPNAVIVTDGPSLKKAVTNLKGKVIVLNVWATWCPPCVAEFPDLVKVDKEYRGKGVVVLGVSVDEPSDRAEVESFIKSSGAEFPIYIRKAGGIDKFIEPISKNWTGAVPTTFIYNRDGKLVGKPHLGLRTYEQFQRILAPLVK